MLIENNKPKQHLLHLPRQAKPVSRRRKLDGDKLDGGKADDLSGLAPQGCCVRVPLVGCVLESPLC